MSTTLEAPTPSESAAQFATEARVHAALAVTNLEESIAFYRNLFDVEPSKLRSNYARFEVAEPPLNLALNQSPKREGRQRLMHFGIQLKSSAAVKSADGRLAALGVTRKVEEQVACCYAVQDKFWVADPDGNEWEIFVTTNDNSDQYSSSAPANPLEVVGQSDNACCEPGCCE